MSPTPHPTRLALIEAGLDLAASTSLNRLTIDAIVNKAGVAKGTFYVHFPDRAAFLVALHIQFHERLLERILSGIEDLPPGARRLRAGAEIYLDECLRERGVKAILLEARSEAPIVAEVQQRNAQFALLNQVDFTAIGWPDAATAASLFVVLVAEAALIELETGRNEALRQTIWRFARIEENESQSQ